MVSTACLALLTHCKVVRFYTVYYTLCAVPTGAPQNVVAISNAYDSITLSWNPPLLEEQNGDIVQYVVNVTHTVTLDRVQYTLTATTITITGLEPYTNYVCVVAAATASGLGPFSTLIHVRTLEAG